jgi:prephenate dehydrogenase
MANRENLARVLAVYIEGLQEVHQALQESDHGSLLDFFERAQTRRNTWISSFQSASSDE